MNNLDVVGLNSMWMDNNIEWSAKWAVGRSDGIITLWKSGLFELVFSFVGKGFLGIHVIWRGNRFILLMCMFHACMIRRRKCGTS